MANLATMLPTVLGVKGDARNLAAVTAVLRGPADAGADSAAPVEFGPLQLLLILGVVVLLLLLVGLVIWRVRRTRSK